MIWDEFGNHGLGNYPYRRPRDDFNPFRQTKLSDLLGSLKKADASRILKKSKPQELELREYMGDFMAYHEASGTFQRLTSIGSIDVAHYVSLGWSFWEIEPDAGASPEHPYFYRRIS